MRSIWIVSVLVSVLILGSIGFSQIVIGQTPQVNIVISAIVNESFPKEGETITYTISLVNTGPSTATNVVANANLEIFTEVNIIDEPAKLIQVGTWDPINGKWSIPSLPVGTNSKDEVFLSFRAQVEQETAGTIVKNTVTVTADELDTEDPNSDRAIIKIFAGLYS